MKLCRLQCNVFHAIFLTIVLTISYVNCAISDNSEPDTLSRNRDPKYFLGISVPPDPCGENNVGVCYPRKRCARQRGTVGSSCAQGFGECCTFASACNATVSALDITEFVTTLRVPMSTSNQCSFRIKKPSRNVCQVRLDFQIMTTNSADEDGICRGDRITIKGSTTVAEGFTTCGALNGQHMYLSYGNSDTIELIVVHMQAAPATDYVIRATQIPCSSSRRAPENCLQYYDTSAAVVKSFDWGPTGQQQSNQQYSICVKKIIAGGSITWSQCSGSNLGSPMGKPFDITTPNPMPGAPTTCDRGDWIQINGRDRICNGAIPSSGLSSSWGPYLLNVNFDAHEQAPLPFSDAMAEADITSCPGIQTAFPNLIDSCTWDPTVPPGTCQCVAKPALNDLTGLPDISNQGFCLQYTQM